MYTHPHKKPSQGLGLGFERAFTRHYSARCLPWDALLCCVGLLLTAVQLQVALERVVGCSGTAASSQQQEGAAWGNGGLAMHMLGVGKDPTAGSSTTCPASTTGSSTAECTFSQPSAAAAPNVVAQCYVLPLQQLQPWPCNSSSAARWLHMARHWWQLLRALLRPQLWHCLELGLLANIAVKLLHLLFCLAVLLACKLRKRQLRRAGPVAHCQQAPQQPQQGGASGASTGKLSQQTGHPTGSPMSHQSSSDSSDSATDSRQQHSKAARSSSSSITLEQQLPQWAITARPWVVGLSSLMPQVGLLLGVLLQPLPAPLLPHSLAYVHSGSAFRPLLFAFYSVQAIIMPVSGGDCCCRSCSLPALHC